VIERWLVAVRDHPNRPPQAQCHVLTMLALRVDWTTGCGFASGRQLGEDADASERTVRRATTWGRDTGFVVRTRRGHRVSAELVIASEWRLTQPATGDLLEKPTGQNGKANRPIGPTQPVTGAAPSRSVSSRPVTSGRAPRAEVQTRDQPLALSELCGRCGGHGHSPRECAI
jgi:hypothetical protein